MKINKSFNFNIDTICENILPVASVKQSDSVLFNITITEQGRIKNLSGASIKLYIRKADGKLVVQDVPVTDPSVGKLSFEVKNSAFQSIGTAVAELEISYDSGLISTATFFFTVSEKIGNNEAVESVVDVPLFKELSNYIETAIQEIQIYKNLVEAFTNAGISIEGLHDIKVYIDSNLTELKSENTKAGELVPKLESINSTATLTANTLLPKVQEGTIIASDLNNKINLAKSLDTTLTSKITLGSSTSSELDSKIIDATNTKNSLYSKISEGNQVNTTLNLTKNQATTVKNELQTVIDSVNEMDFVQASKMTEILKSYTKQEDIAESITTKTVSATKISSNEGFIAGAFGQKSSYSSNNFNNYITEGHYRIASDSPLMNAPFNDEIYGKLIVIVVSGGTLNMGTDSEWCWQIFYATNWNVYIRSNIHNSWTPWKQISYTDDTLRLIYHNDYMTMHTSPNQWGEDFIRTTNSGLLPYADERGFIGHPNNKYFYEMCAIKFSTKYYRMFSNEYKDFIIEGTSTDSNKKAIFKDMAVATDDLLIAVDESTIQTLGLEETELTDGKSYASIKEVITSLGQVVQELQLLKANLLSD